MLTRLNAVLLLAAVLSLVGCRRDDPPAPTPPVVVVKEEPEKKSVPLRTREELKTALQGKTKDEVLALLGKPSRTSGDGDQWDYHQISRDPVSDKTDVTTWIWFGKDGRVNRFSFF